MAEKKLLLGLLLLLHERVHCEWLAAVQLWAANGVKQSSEQGRRKIGRGDGMAENKKLFTTHKFPTLVLRHIILRGETYAKANTGTNLILKPAQSEF